MPGGTLSLARRRRGDPDVELDQPFLLRIVGHRVGPGGHGVAFDV